ncbi:hypothetical protein Acy02nite_00460 [Actinoplanes cyaneus]|uniref:Uncharacterized protein n=1 Tax=Actinoplanes cyaneus TaxID=52696 RepID=A0A919LXQ3_9ACTN|nr:hypothetical protein Acy02nite_00460 [Actinoplanes cyaneus]
MAHAAARLAMRRLTDPSPPSPEPTPALLPRPAAARLPLPELAPMGVINRG